MGILRLSGCLLLISLCVFGAPCLPGTLQDYINLSPSGCTVNEVQLFDFYTAAGQSFAVPFDPAAILVTPLSGGSNITLLLTLSAAAGPGDLLESFFHFSAASGGLLGASIGLGLPVVTEDGAITGILDVCAGGLFNPIEPSGCAGTPLTAIAFATALDSQLTSAVSTPISSFFDVFVDITIDGGLSGSASLDSTSVSLQTPESSTLLLVAVPLVAVGILKSRRRRRE